MSFEIPGEKNLINWSINSVFIHCSINSNFPLVRKVFVQEVSSLGWGTQVPFGNYREEIHAVRGHHRHTTPPILSHLVPIHSATGLLKAMAFLLLKFNTRSGLIRGAKVTTRSWAGLMGPSETRRGYPGSLLLTSHILKCSKSHSILFSDLESDLS